MRLNSKKDVGNGQGLKPRRRLKRLKAANLVSEFLKNG